MRYGLVVLALTAAPAFAQERPTSEGWSLNVGAGGLLAPSYEGDDKYRVSILPNIQVTYGDDFFASVQEGVGYRVIHSDTLRAGPIGRIRFSRDEDGDQPFAVTGDDSTDLAGLGDIDTGIELGGFLEYEIGNITLSAEARKAVSGHEGLVADIGARWSGRMMAFGPPVIWSIGPRARIVDETFNAAYFGVTPTQSLASGLPVYNAEGGLYSYGVGATAIIPLDRDNRWTAVAFAGYDRLTGDAADSPLVQLRGAEDQANVGIFVSYRLF
ncbi:MAG: MipA/OmpV family protein [Alphaproteobacteria bacterium]|nr:MAG: MipA/OmpV family protein [Alphaproteobacteria bacterium]